LKALAITDHGTVSGHLEHLNACKKAGIKPIFGVELYVTPEPAPQRLNRHNNHMVVWAKNKQGLFDLWKMVSLTNDPEYFYFKPRIQLWDWINPETKKLYPGIETFTKNGNIMGFSGHQGSALADSLFADLFGDPDKRKADIRTAYNQKKGITDSEYFRKYLKPNWLESTCDLALKLEKIFGKGNFFVELQNELNPKDQLALWIHPLIVECLREVSKNTGITAVASSDPHYPSQQDAIDQRLMVMSNLKETEESVERKLNDENENDVMVFFGSDSFYIHDYNEMADKFTQEELENTNKIADIIESFDITAKPQVPNFPLPEFDKDDPFLDNAPTDADKYLLYLCIEGAKKIQPWKNSKYSKENYWQRLQEEMQVIYEAGLSKYFLVVQDYCKAGDFRPADHSFEWEANLKKNGALDPIPRGTGRGSAAGCLISYLIGITGVDPLLYELIFSRFYNKGRNSGEHVEMPDIDIDFAVEDREWIIEYISHRYGKDNVCQIITFQTMKGKAAIKDICRVKNIVGGFELSNEIAKFIPDEASVADELQTMRDAGHENYGLIQWALDNSEEILEYYNRPQLKGVFEQAIRCEGVKKSQGRHPSGIVVTPKAIEECFPMALDTKSKQRIVSLDMNDSARLGAIKLDVLGTAILDKLKMTQDLINGVVPRRNRVSDYIEIED
jgi:DNA polymerase-3 subunit alpha